MTDLSTWTPSQVDVVLAEIWERQMDAQARVQREQRHADNYAEGIAKAEAGDSRYLGYTPDYLDEILARVEEQQAIVFACQVEAAPYADEFVRRGGWTRAYKVLNSNGHIHTSMDCGTCYPTTRFGWLPQVSGSTEDEIVALAGEGACTICYPSAPCVGPNTLYTPIEAAERAARDAEREAKRSAKVAKSLSLDGSVVELRWTYGENRTAWKDIKTYRSAELFVIESLSYSCVPSYDVAPIETVNEVLDMMAAKKGQPVSEIGEALQVKANAKRAKRVW